jgi:hypothetical protein
MIKETSLKNNRTFRVFARLSIFAFVACPLLFFCVSCSSTQTMGGSGADGGGITENPETGTGGSGVSEEP